VNRHDLALIGFGGVNRALAELIDDRGTELAAELGFELRVVAITDLRLGSLMQADGIDLSQVLSLGVGHTFAGLIGGDEQPRNEYVIRNTTADTVVEATFTNPVDGEPAISHVRWALESGKHVTTTNKGPVALAGAELHALAAEHGVRFEHEGAVLSGTPILRLSAQMFAGLRINGVQGILNGTSNFVLGRMEAGLSLHEAVAEAQELGYAEADPTADIEGSDVQLKVVILANEILGAAITTADVSRRGLSTVSAGEIAEAEQQGRRWKLIGTARRNADGSVAASVEPVALSLDHPLAGISGATNAVAFDTDLLGTVMVSGPGAGRVETAYALLSDLIAIDAGRGALVGAGSNV
jgi:homoserine dehydrogenase